MPKTAGALLINRVNTGDITHGQTLTVKTGIAQVSKAFGTDPGLLARIMVIPLPPLDNWYLMTHGDPFYDVDGDIAVTFTNGSGQTVPLNVMFVDFHSLAGPGGYTDSYVIGPPQ